MTDERVTPAEPAVSEPAAPAPVAAPEPEITPEPAPARPCANCGTPLLGEHCYACGQPVKGLVRHFSSIAGDFVDSVLNFDARTIRTLGPLLLRPGHLSIEYFEGRRIRYVSPVRLFVFLCVIAFFVLQLAIDPANMNSDPAFDDAQTVAEVERLRDQRLQELQKQREEMRLEATPGTPAEAQEASEIGIETAEEVTRALADTRITWLRERDAAARNGTAPPKEPDTTAEIVIMGGKAWHPTENPLRMDWAPDWFTAWVNGRIGHMQENLQQIRRKPQLLLDACLQTLPQTLFVLLPLFAMLLKLAYVFKRRLYMEHLIVALHSHAFMCLALMLLVGLDELDTLLKGNPAVQSIVGPAIFALSVWIPLYLLLTQKRVYGQGWIMTLLKFAVLGTCYVVLISLGATLNVMFNLVAM